MVTRDFSGEDVYKVLVSVEHVRTRGDHVMLRKDPPESHNTEPRLVTVPLHDRLRIGTLRQIATDAGARDFTEFCKWIDRNR